MKLKIFAIMAICLMSTFAWANDMQAVVVDGGQWINVLNYSYNGSTYDVTHPAAYNMGTTVDQVTLIHTGGSNQQIAVRTGTVWSLLSFNGTGLSLVGSTDLGTAGLLDSGSKVAVGDFSGNNQDAIIGRYYDGGSSTTIKAIKYNTTTNSFYVDASANIGSGVFNNVAVGDFDSTRSGMEIFANQANYPHELTYDGNGNMNFVLASMMGTTFQANTVATPVDYLGNGTVQIAGSDGNGQYINVIDSNGTNFEFSANGIDRGGDILTAAMLGGKFFNDSGNEYGIFSINSGGTYAKLMRVVDGTLTNAYGGYFPSTVMDAGEQVVADINNDGLDEILLLNNGGLYLSLLESDGTGSLSMPAQWVMSNYGLSSVTDLQIGTLIPEPTSLAIIGIGCVLTAIRSRRMKY